MSISTSYRRGLLVAGSFAVLAAAALPLAAQPAPAPSNPNIPPMSQGRPGFSPTVPRRTLVNLKLGIETERYDISVWAKNLFDSRYATSGFFDGGIVAPLGIQVFQGDGRIIGGTASAAF